MISTPPEPTGVSAVALTWNPPEQEDTNARSVQAENSLDLMIVLPFGWILDVVLEFAWCGVIEGCRSTSGGSGGSCR